MTDADSMILPSDPRAAQPVQVTAWRSATGYVSLDEDLARRDGATHVRCDGCSTPIPKNQHLCEACRDRRDAEVYRGLPREAWDGQCALYSDNLDRYFMDGDELRSYLVHAFHCPDDPAAVRRALEHLRLQLCYPQFAHELDPGEVFDDLIPPDNEGEVPDWLSEAFEALNATIREHAEKSAPLSWMVDQVAADVDSVIRVLAAATPEG